MEAPLAGSLSWTLIPNDASTQGLLQHTQVFGEKLVQYVAAFRDLQANKMLPTSVNQCLWQLQHLGAQQGLQPLAKRPAHLHQLPVLATRDNHLNIWLEALMVPAHYRAYVTIVPTKSMVQTKDGLLMVLDPTTVIL